MRIVERVYFWAKTKPLHPAIIEPEGVITYTALAQAIEAAAEHFARYVADRSKPVAVSLASSSKMLIAVLGLLRARLSVVLAYDEVFEHLPSVGASTLVGERGAKKLPYGTNIAFEDFWLQTGTQAGKRVTSLPRIDGSEADIICFTSGTTGRPQTVVCPERGWQERMLFPLNSAFSNYERILIVPGVGTSLGLSRAYEALHTGRTACFAPFGYPTLWLLNTYGIDTVLTSPQPALQLVEFQESARFPLRSLKSFQIGASAISRDGIVRIKKNLCRNVTIIYGSTEAGVVAAAPYDMIADTPGAVGYILPGVAVEVVDSYGRAQPTGKEGFVRVRSPVLEANVVAGTKPDDWFYPGDLGWLTEQGALCIAGRASDVINRGGEKLSMTDFENFLMTCSGVKDASVCSTIGQSGFEEVWAAVVFNPSVNVTVFRQEIDTNGQFGRKIDKLFVVDAIPRGNLGKVQRDELKMMLMAIGEEAAQPHSTAETPITDDRQRVN